MTGEEVERLSPDRGPHAVLNRNDLIADLFRSRLADGHKHVQLRITLIDGHESAGWLTKVEVDRVNGTIDLVAERYQP